MVADSEKFEVGSPSAQDIKPKHLRSSTAWNRSLCRERFLGSQIISICFMYLVVHCLCLDLADSNHEAASIVTFQ